jgi:DNA-binding CsgD family transcriptional regulator
VCRTSAHVDVPCSQQRFWVNLLSTTTLSCATMCHEPSTGAPAQRTYRKVSPVSPARGSMISPRTDLLPHQSQTGSPAPTRHRNRPTIGWDSLTPTELHVADLVCEGLTNREIAARLSMGAETVKTHISHIFSKLGISKRSQLAVITVEKHHDEEREPGNRVS